MTSEMLDNAASEVLSSKRVLMKAPSAHKLSEMYPSQSQVSTQLAEAVNSRGRSRVSEIGRASCRERV